MVVLELTVVRLSSAGIDHLTPRYRFKSLACYRRIQPTRTNGQSSLPSRLAHRRYAVFPGSVLYSGLRCYRRTWLW